MKGESPMPEEQAHSSVPLVFEMPIRVETADIDAMGHVNNIVYLRWVQEAATAHWNAAASEQQKAEYAWVALRHEIDYLRPALPGDELIARTHVGEASGARFDRYVEILRVPDNQALARARTVWAALDARTGKPRRVGKELLARFHVPDSDDGPENAET
jgi:acyl-CoA thioester hydrolase